MAGPQKKPIATQDAPATSRDGWSQKFRAATDEDPTIGAQAKYYTCTYLLDMERAQVLVGMIDGKAVRVELNPGGLEAYDFAIRASADTWRKFAADPPPPMYHGIWAATFRADMKLEGNITVLMQNLRNLTAQLELLRKTGVPV